ncbi:MAG TPA: hypothetical protein RWO66_01420 [Ruminococcus sp.]
MRQYRAELVRYCRKNLSLADLPKDVFDRKIGSETCTLSFKAGLFFT